MLSACRGVGERFWGGDEVCANWIVMNVVRERFETLAITNLTLIERGGPDWELVSEPVRKVTLDELDRFLKRDLRSGSEDGVQVVRHYDEGVKVKSVFSTLLGEYIQEAFGIGFDLEEAAAICGCCGNEVSAKVLRGPVYLDMIAEGQA